MVRELSADSQQWISQHRLVHHNDGLDGPATAERAYDRRDDVGQRHHTANHVPAVDGRFRLYQRRNCFSSMVRPDGPLDGTTRWRLGQLDDKRKHDGSLSRRLISQPPSDAAPKRYWGKLPRGCAEVSAARLVRTPPRNDHELFPDAICVIGAHEAGDGLVMEYFDSRGVRRTYGRLARRRVLRMRRNHAGFDQRFSATLEPDTFEGQWQLAETPGAWQDDLKGIYRRRDYILAARPIAELQRAAFVAA